MTQLGTSSSCVSSCNPIVVEDYVLSPTGVRGEPVDVRKIRIRSLIVDRTEMVGEERFLLLNPNELDEVKEEVKVENFNNEGLFIKRIGERKVVDDVTVIKSDSDSDDMSVERRKRFCRGLQSTRVKGRLAQNR